MTQHPNIHAAVFSRARLESKRSQTSWAKLLKIERTTLNKIEKGVRLPSELQKTRLTEAMKKTYAKMKIEFIESI